MKSDIRKGSVKPIGYCFFTKRSAVALVVAILVALVVLPSAPSEQAAAQTTSPGQKFIAGGNTHSMALKKDGTVWAWGQRVRPGRRWRPLSDT
jgi:Na+/H+-dicarboxylate symporter